jgi:hypothetical protein
VNVVRDADEAARTIRAARDDAPAWPGWGACRSYYLAWVDPSGQLQSMLFIDPDVAENSTRAQLAAAVRRQGTRIESAARHDGDATMQTTLLYVIVDLDGTTAGPGYGVLGQRPNRCRPLTELVERAITDLATAADTDRR